MSDFVVWKNVPNEIKRAYVFQCMYCDANVTQEWSGELVMTPCHPGKGWREYGATNWVCPSHTVEIFVDGKKLEG